METLPYFHGWDRGFGGQQRMGYLRFIHIIMPIWGSTNHSFPWKSIQGARVPWKAAFFGKKSNVGEILTIELCKRHLLITDCCFECVREAGLTSFCFIVQLRQISGRLFLLCLGQFGWCQYLWLSSWNVVNDNSISTGFAKFGKLLLYVLCRPFGVKETGQLLMVLSYLFL